MTDCLERRCFATHHCVCVDPNLAGIDYSTTSKMFSPVVTSSNIFLKRCRLGGMLTRQERREMENLRAYSDVKGKLLQLEQNQSSKTITRHAARTVSR
jgi:hypothetical protein